VPRSRPLPLPRPRTASRSSGWSASGRPTRPGHPLPWQVRPPAFRPRAASPGGPADYVATPAPARGVRKRSPRSSRAAGPSRPWSCPRSNGAPGARGISPAVAPVLHRGSRAARAWPPRRVPPLAPQLRPVAHAPAAVRPGSALPGPRAGRRRAASWPPKHSSGSSRPCAPGPGRSPARHRPRPPRCPERAGTRSGPWASTLKVSFWRAVTLGQES
jgi:hypothetical protein